SDSLQERCGLLNRHTNVAVVTDRHRSQCQISRSRSLSTVSYFKLLRRPSPRRTRVVRETTNASAAGSLEAPYHVTDAAPQTARARTGLRSIDGKMRIKGFAARAA